MLSKIAIWGLITSAALVFPALAQTNKMPAASQPVATTHANMWRASKVIGLNVYNDKGDKVGDINEILINKSGKVDGVVVGVGGFLGMGEHDIMVEMNKLQFVDDSVRTSSTTNTKPANTANTRTRTTGANVDRSSSSSHKWYPDHAVLSGTTKDGLKSMPQFKYD